MFGMIEVFGNGRGQPTATDEKHNVAVDVVALEDFLQTPFHGVQAEWVHGHIVEFMAPSIKHQVVTGFLFMLLSLFLRHKKLGRVFVSPVDMNLKATGTVREPDVLFIVAGKLELVTEKRLEGPADLVIEVVSDDSAIRDYVDKRYEYQKAGIQEYWIIDPRDGYQHAEFYRLNERGRYVPLEPDDAGIFHSHLLEGLMPKLEQLWSEDPDALASLAEMTGL